MPSTGNLALPRGEEGKPSSKRTPLTAEQRSAAWMVGCLFASMFFLWGSGRNAQALFVPPLLKTFGWNRTQVSELFAAANIFTALSASMSGWLLERIQARLVMIGGAVVACSGYLLASSAGSLPPLMAGFALLGAGLGASTWVPVSWLVARAFDTNRGRVTGFAIAGASVGGVIMIVSGNYVLLDYGWRALCVYFALPMVIVLVPLIMATIPDTRSAPKSAPGVAPPVVVGLTRAEAVRGLAFWMMILIQAFYSLGLGGIGLHFIAYLEESGYSATTAAYLISFRFIFAAIGQVGSGWLADRIGARLTMSLALIGLGGAFALLMAPGYPVILILAVVLWGTTIPMPAVLASILQAESLGLKSFASIYGLMFLAQNLGLSVGPLITGKIFDLTGSYKAALELNIVIMLVCSLCPLGCKPLAAQPPAAART